MALQNSRNCGYCFRCEQNLCVKLQVTAFLPQAILRFHCSSKWKISTLNEWKYLCNSIFSLPFLLLCLYERSWPQTNAVLSWSSWGWASCQTCLCPRLSVRSCSMNIFTCGDLHCMMSGAKGALELGDPGFTFLQGLLLRGTFSALVQCHPPGWVNGMFELCEAQTAL